VKFDGFIQELKQKSISRVINTRILGGAPICFRGDPDLILELKKSIADQFGIHVKNVEIVGSAKLGLSLSQKRLGQRYRKESDVDLVLVSSELFDRGWHDLLQLEFKFYQLSEKDRQFLLEAYHTIHHGFISPDRLPPCSKFGEIWWRIFDDVSMKERYENRKIRGRLFKSWWFAEKYYSIQLFNILKDEGGRDACAPYNILDQLV
jgi:predicted nucleotidyltransferase